MSSEQQKTPSLLSSLLNDVDTHNITQRFIQPHIDDIKHRIKPYIYLHIILQIIIVILLIFIFYKISRKY